MYTIEEFAAIGRISVRMLRHYDAIGLLHPARVDERSGSRRYDPAQLAELDRVLMLKDLGFPLEQVARIVHDDPGADVLRTLLEQPPLTPSRGIPVRVTNELRVHFRPNPVNGWFFRLFTTPWVDVDGVDHECAWRAATLIAVRSGRHEIAGSIRCRGSRRPLGTGRLELDVPAEGTVDIEVRNGPLNGDPFVPRVAVQRGQLSDGARGLSTSGRR